MGFSILDYCIVGAYLLVVTSAGMFLTGRQRTALDYFLGGRSLSWPLVGLSIAAGETSALTVISVPGIAYAGTMHFLQLVFGYVVGRMAVSLVFIPAYYRGTLETAYDFLGKRFGLSLRKFSSTVFIVTRVLASGVRLFATAIPVHMITGLSYANCILIIGFFTLAYTAAGGLRAVVAMDVAQLVVYLAGAVASFVLILSRVPGGWQGVVAIAHAQVPDKFSILDVGARGPWSEFFSNPYTLLGGVIGGAFLSMASHGTDQLIVQRLLACSSKAASQKALMLDAFVILVQFAFFLVLGIGLFAYYRGASVGQLGLATTDEVFPFFIIHELPFGLSGLMVAGILASAMGTLSTSISSLASSTYLDILKPLRRRALDSAEEMRWSRGLTLAWGLALIGGAMLFTDTHNPVVELGLTIASFTYGALLGTFFLGLLFRKTTSLDAYAGFLASITVMISVLRWTAIAYTWHTVIGCSVAILAGNIRPLCLWLVRTRN
ncbi:MAG TPA: sodium:solute symporter [Bacteroidota bacterium]|nr:sodium:solute symporter [Bacteroidota bacterium]